MINPSLLTAAAQTASNAHAPYSRYKVGAALLCSDGTVFAGCNVENASYGLTNCAERSALFSAISSGQRTFIAIAIVADGESVPLPCGACRQVMAEFCEPTFEIYCATADHLNNAVCFTLDELLPHAFVLERDSK